MNYLSNKAVSIIIWIPLLLVTVLHVFGSDKNEIPEECRQYIKDCDNNLSKQLSELLSKISTNKATPEELGTFWDILGQIDKHKDLISKNLSGDPEITFLTQSITKELHKWWEKTAIVNNNWWWINWNNNGTKIIYLTSYVDRYPDWSTNRIWWWAESENNTWGWWGNNWGWWGGWGSTVWTPYRCPNPIWWAIEHGKSVFLYKSLVVNYPEQCQWENRVCNNGTLLWSFTEEGCTQIGKSCSSDRWVIEHGKTISSYKSLTIPYGEDCSKNIDIITCTDGKLSGELKFKSCTELAPKWCIWPDGKVRWHGVIWAYYSTAQLVWAVTDGEDKCIRKSLKCNNGTRRNTWWWVEWFGGFNQLTCTARINTQQ